MYNTTVEKIKQYSGMDADSGKDLLKLSAYKDIGGKISSLMAGGSSKIAADFAHSLHNREAVGGTDFMQDVAKVAAIRARAERLKHCADNVVFGKEVGGGFKLAYANFCRDRLCPACQWRRALKTGGQMREIMAALEEEGFLFLMVTYTLPNCETEALGESVDLLQRAHRRLLRRKRFGFIKGTYRGIEITRNHDVGSASYLTWHPHIHSLWCVRKSYFHSRDYVRMQLLLDEWNDCLRKEGYEGPPCKVIDMRKLQGCEDLETQAQALAAAAAEVCKYTMKPSDILTGNEAIDLDTISALMRFAHGRRFISLTGAIKEKHKALHLDDIDDPKKLDDVCGKNIEYYVGYAWKTGITTYVGSWNAIQEMLHARTIQRFNKAAKAGASADELQEICIENGELYDTERRKYFAMHERE